MSILGRSTRLDVAYPRLHQQELALRVTIKPALIALCEQEDVLMGQ